MSATTDINQTPLSPQLPVGQEIIFAVANQTAVANQLRVKFIAQVYISSTMPNLGQLVGTFKTTPNNAGVGMFDFSNVVESHVKADNLAYNVSKYKGVFTTDNNRHPLHLIDKFSLNANAVKYMNIRFAVEYLGATDSEGNQDNNIVREQVGTHSYSEIYTIFNGYLKYTDHLEENYSSVPAGFGYDLTTFYPTGAVIASKKFLTNSPVNLYANLEDYGTLAFLTPSSSVASDVNTITFTYYDSTGTPIGTPDIVDRDYGSGAYSNWDAGVKKQLVYFGCYPGNLQNWSTNFQALVTAGTIEGGYYRIQVKDSTTPIAFQSVKTYTINVNCPNTKGYESIRLTWLNQWGAWDYYTFTKKSVKSISTQGSTYNQLGGTWNESRYRIDSFKGGKKAFRVNATEKITMNTGFVIEDDTVMFEELINSPEVYILEGYQTDGTQAALNQYVTPARLTTSSFTRKTVANDRLMQYTFEVEKSKTLRTQAV